MAVDKKEVWEIIENYAPNLSNEIGWGSMDSLCDNLIEYIQEK